MPIDIGRIHIDGASQQAGWTSWRYERAVRNVVRTIEGTMTGSIVLDSLRRRTAIVPYPSNLARNADCDVAPGAPYAAGYRANDFLYSCGDGTRLQGHGFGTGAGADARVRFTPGQWIPGARDYAGPTGPGGHVDEVLLHELVHAVRVTIGLGDCRQLQGRLAGYDNRSEFYAVLVENVYSSETHRDPRRDHHAWVKLTNPQQYYAQPQNKLMIMDFCRSQSDFTRALANVRCDFNPFREYYVEVGVIRPRVRRSA